MSGPITSNIQNALRKVEQYRQSIRNVQEKQARAHSRLDQYAKAITDTPQARQEVDALIASETLARDGAAADLARLHLTLAQLTEDLKAASALIAKTLT